MKNKLLAGILGLLGVWLVINTLQISQLQSELATVSKAKGSSQKKLSHREKVVGQARTSTSDQQPHKKATQARRNGGNQGKHNDDLGRSENTDMNTGDPEEDDRIRKLVAEETQRKMNQRTERWQEMARERMTERLDEFSSSYDLNSDDSAALQDVVGGYMEDRMSSYWSVMEGDITREQAKEEMAAAKADTQEAVIEFVGEDGLEELSEKLGHRADLGRE